MSALKLIKRYTSKAIGIILDRHAPPPTGKLTEDPEGEWMRWNDLAILYNKGVLIEKTEALDELVADGHAQRALIRDIEAMGYTDFDTVMSVLREFRATVLEPREFEVWDVGYQATGEYAPPTCLGKTIAICFEEACRELYNAERAAGSHRFTDWKFDERSKTWSNYCGTLVHTEPK